MAVILLLCTFSFHACGSVGISPIENQIIDLTNIPAYNGKAYIAINDNIPFFNETDLTTVSYESYGEMDELGRCTTASACLGKDLMPDKDRGSIGHIRPSGWQTAKYDFIEGKYLYNRCHLIGYQLTGENANGENLITGTRYLNMDGMLPFENMTADYIKETGNHVMYRVSPVFEDSDLLARGVIMEGLSVEDKGEGICFCVYLYNVQPGVAIDYSTGDSTVSKDDKSPEKSQTYILNTHSKKIHRPDCPSVTSMKDEYKQKYKGDIRDLTQAGYEPCQRCLGK